jgi:hypothetical protein
MSWKPAVAVCCFAVVGLAALAWAQEGSLSKRPDGSIEMVWTGGIPDDVREQLHARSARFQVIAVGDRAILFNASTGETWYDADTAAHGRAWLPMKRIALSDAESDNEAHAASAEAHDHHSHDHEHAEGGHDHEPLTDTPQSR